MRVSPLNADARFVLPTFLDSEIVDRLKRIPGVQVWSKQPIVRCAAATVPAVRKHLPASTKLYTSAFVPPPPPETWKPPIPDDLWQDFLVDYQRDAIRKLVRIGGGLVEAPTGAGKTLIGDAAALALVQRPMWAESRERPILLTVCKASARTQQAEEKQRFFGITPYAIKPASLKRKRDRWASLTEYLNDPEILQPWLIVSWSGIAQLAPMLITLPIGCVIFDEAHYAKSSDRVKWEVYVDDEGETTFERKDKLNRTGAADKLASRIPHRILTTATPTKNRLQDWWGLLNLIERPGFGHGFSFEAYGSTISKFLRHYCNGDDGPYGGIVTHPPHYSNVAELRARIDPVRVQIPYAVLAAQLPPKRRRIQAVPPDAQDKPLALSRKDRARYKASLRELAEHERTQATEGLELSKERVTVWRLQDACNRKRTATVDLVCSYIDNARGSATDPLLPRGKVLLFFGLVRALEAVAVKIKKARKHARVWTAHGEGCHEVQEDGSLVPTDIDTIKRAYMETHKPAVIVGTYQYIGESHNMQDSDAIIVGMLPYTPGEVAQIEGRGARLGQARPLDVVYLQAEGTIDDRCRHLVIDKLPAVAALGDGAHGLDGLSHTLRGIDDIESVLDAFVAGCMSEEGGDE